MLVAKLLVWQGERANVFVCKMCKSHLGFDPLTLLGGSFPCSKPGCEHTLSCFHLSLALLPLVAKPHWLALLQCCWYCIMSALSLCTVTVCSESCCISYFKSVTAHNYSFGYAYKQGPKFSLLMWQMSVKMALGSKLLFATQLLVNLVKSMTDIKEKEMYYLVYRRCFLFLRWHTVHSVFLQ